MVLIAMAFHMLAVIMHIAHRSCYTHASSCCDYLVFVLVLLHTHTSALRIPPPRATTRRSDAYAADGIGKVGVDDFGLALEQIPQLLLVALFICVGKGLYISTQTIKDVRSVVEVMVLYLIASIVLLYWSYTQENIATSEYAYLTAPGMCIIVLRLVTLLWFLSCFQATWRQERMQYKRNFYLGFGLFGAMFFLALPIIALALLPLVLSHSSFPHLHLQGCTEKPKPHQYNSGSSGTSSSSGSSASLSDTSR